MPPRSWPGVGLDSVSEPRCPPASRKAAAAWRRVPLRCGHFSTAARRRTTALNGAAQLPGAPHPNPPVLPPGCGQGGDPGPEFADRPEQRTALCQPITLRDRRRTRGLGSRSGARRGRSRAEALGCHNARPPAPDGHGASRTQCLRAPWRMNHRSALRAMQLLACTAPPGLAASRRILAPGGSALARATAVDRACTFAAVLRYGMPVIGFPDPAWLVIEYEF